MWMLGINPKVFFLYHCAVAPTPLCLFNLGYLFIVSHYERFRNILWYSLLFLHFLESVLWFRKLLTLVYFLFTYVVLLVLLSLSYINNCFIPIFKNFIILVIKIVFLIHFELFFIEHEKGIPIYSFTRGYQVGAILLPRTFPHLIVSSKITVFKYNDLFRVFSMCC